MTGTTARRTAHPRNFAPLRWGRELWLGARMSVSGGRDAWIRLALITSGIGVAVALLLVAAAAPGMSQNRQGRYDMRSYDVSTQLPEPTEQTLLIADVGTRYHGESVYGRLLTPEGAEAPLPPGVDEFPGPGRMVVSPGLERLLDSAEGELLKERLDYRVVGTVGDEGLADPGELVYYAGAEPGLLDPDTPSSHRIDGFGYSPVSTGLQGPALVLALAGAVVALLPLGVFVAAALRFGSDRRDRRLAVLRLIGADAWTAARTACGETLIGALAGIGAGFGLFYALRPLTASIEIGGVGGFAAALVPHPLLAVAVPVGVAILAAAVTLVSTARAAADPLGTARRTARPRRRLWWRIALFAVGVGLLATFDMQTSETALVGGILALLVGAGLVTPWLFQIAVSRVRRGSVPVLLAARRLHVDGSSESRAVVGLVVVVTGAVALQTLMAGSEQRRAEDALPAGERVYSAHVPDLPVAGAAEVAERVGAVPQVDDAGAVAEYWGVESPNGPVSLHVGSCAALRDLARIGGCSDGGVFAVEGAETPVEQGQRLRIRSARGTAAWELPEAAPSVAPRDPVGLGGGPEAGAVLATTGAVDGADLPRTSVSVLFGFDTETPRAVERARNAVAEFSPLALRASTAAGDGDDTQLARVSALVYAGVGAALAVVGLGLLISAVERLRTTKRELAVLAAAGTPKRVLALSMLYQAAIPLGVGLAVSAAVGIPLGAVLLDEAGVPFAVDTAAIAGTIGAAAAVVLSVTALSLPALATSTRPENLRTE
ncbi:FtsX-like permease family protein [Streptomonospora salina]|uniref:ABC3 transporter permease C-terminal domain-containing protein n=1 Tax=Streptomonospora salina TaxID=104205 RepID=A0A841ECT3_9ACTN|nr:FtsX-like permease family protein [Streptomonospora salina]MBB5998270.1 hypothetical protein [Streptomonospora salina]